MFPYGRQCIDEDDIAAVVETLRSDFLTTGPKIEEFEEALCQKTGANYAVACGNGTLALHLAGAALDFQKGDYAIVPSLTFLATANAVRYCGGDVIFSDVDPDAGLMRPEDFQAALDRAEEKGIRVKAVFPVHLTGQCVDLEKIGEIAKQHNITVIADGAHSVGANYNGKLLGKVSAVEMTTYSFHPVKTIAMGEGGAVITSNKILADKMRILRSHGMEKTPDAGPWAYEMKDIGFNYRVTDIQCALGLSQMKKLEQFVSRRRELADLYDTLLVPLSPLVLPPKRVPYSNSAWHLYAPRFDFEAIGLTRAELMSALMEKEIGTQVHYIPVHTQPYYKELYGALNLPGVDTYYKNTLSLPLYPSLTNEDVEYIAKILTDIIEAAKK